MTRRRLSVLIDAIAAGRRPKRLQIEPDEAEVVRSAITLRAARPSDASPSDAFVESLFERLSEQANAPVAAERRPVPARRARQVLVAAAAAAVLVVGTVVATEKLDTSTSAPSAAQVPHGTGLRTGTFQTTDGQVMGQIVAYRGRPSWVFMNVAVPGYEGRIECKLQVADGTTVAFGTFTMRNGVGQFSRALTAVNIARLRGAKLVNPAGSVVAAATFAG